MVRTPKRVVSNFFPTRKQAVPDYIQKDLDVLFCGINPGSESGAQQRHYAHRSNHFYICVHESGLTSQRLVPSDDWSFPLREPYKLGLTNLAHRPTARSEQLNKSELEAGVPQLIEKVREFRPKVVCFVGKQIGQVFMRVIRQESLIGSKSAKIRLPRSVLGFWFDPKQENDFPRGDAGYGVLPACIVHEKSITLFFSTPSTSARVTHHQLPGKIRIMSHIVPLLASFPDINVNKSNPNEDTQEIEIPCIKD